MSLFLYGLRIALYGGQQKFVEKMLDLDLTKESDRKKAKIKAVENSGIHVKCKFSEHNGGKCKYPCLFCNDFKGVDNAVVKKSCK